jgi:hypothetical protein
LISDINDAVSSTDKCSQKNLLLFIDGNGEITIPCLPPDVFSLRIVSSDMKSVDFNDKDSQIVKTPFEIGEVHFFHNENYDLLFRESKPFAQRLLNHLVFPFPQREIRVGESFLPSTNILPGIAIEAKVAGFATYNKFTTVKIIAEKQLGKDDFQSYFQATGEELVLTHTGVSGDDYDAYDNRTDISEEVMALLQEQKNQVKKEEKEWLNTESQQKMYYKTVVYVDIKSGLVVYREDVNIYDGQSTVSMFQIS